MNIAEARKAKGLTQAELAELVGVSASAVGQWEMEKGTRPDPANARRLMALLPELTFEDIYPLPEGKAA